MCQVNVGKVLYDYFGLLVPADSDIAKKDSLALEELKTLPILVPQQMNSRVQRLDGFESGMLHAVGSYNLITNATYMVEQGLGYAFVLANLVNTEGRNLKFLPFDTEVKNEAFIVTKKYAYFSKAARLLLKRLRENTTLKP